MQRQLAAWPFMHTDVLHLSEKDDVNIMCVRKGQRESGFCVSAPLLASVPLGNTDV